jgi:hypothetical protein
LTSGRRRLASAEAAASEASVPPVARVCARRIDPRAIVREVDEDFAADVDLVAIAKEVLRDGLAVDERAVGAAEVFRNESSRIVTTAACSPLTAA